MTIFTKTANDLFAPVDSAGNLRQIQPHDAQVWGTEVERVLQSVSAGGGVIFQSKAQADANLGYDANTMAWIFDDDPSLAGIYQKQGASGSGSWVKTGDLPYSFIRATNTNSGDPNAITADTAVPIPAADGGALISLNIVAENTADAPTVSFNGGPALTITDAAGNPVGAGGLTAGMLINGYVVGNTFRADMGPRGWSPLLRVVNDGARRVLELYDWTGGHGAKPSETGYVGPSGLTDDIAQATDIRGPVGPSGPGTGDMLRSVYDPGSLGKNAFDGFPVSTRAELKGLNPDIFTAARLTEQGREGTFVWKVGDYSVPVAADTREGVYIKANSVAATEGAWVRAFDGPYNIRWFGAISDQAGVDCHAAIQGAINLIEANEPNSASRYGRALFFPAGQYETSQQITIRDPGIRLIGEGSVTSVIKAQAGITGTAVIYAQPGGTSGSLVGHGVIGLGLDCNLQPVHGYWGEVLYDNILFDDFRISAVAGDRYGFYTARKTGHDLQVQQTISIRKLFVAKYDQPGTVPAIYIRNCQEVLIEESKGWNSNVANSGSDPVWLIEDCRSLTMIECSAANSKIGIQVHGATRSCVQISIISPLYENVGIPLRATAVDTTVPILNLYHVNPRHQNAASDGYDLDYTRLGYVETTSSPVVLGANSQTTTVLSASRTLVTDSGSRNQIRATRNLVDDFEYFGHNISVWDHAAGQALLQTAMPVSAETGLLVAVNRGGSITLDKVVVGSPDSAGTGFRALRVAN